MRRSILSDSRGPAPRATPTLNSVLRILAAAPDRCLGAEAVFQALRQEGTTVSLPNVYRVLRLLAARGVLVSEWHLSPPGNGKRIYRLKPEHPERQDFLVCRQCQRRVGFMDENLREQLVKVARQHGLGLADRTMTIEVVCLGPPLCQLARPGDAQVRAQCD